MKYFFYFSVILLNVIFADSCEYSHHSKKKNSKSITLINKSKTSTAKIFPGVYSTAKYVPLLRNKNVALVVNQSSIANNTHLSDTLLSLDVNVMKIFAPEHGFRGKADAGKKIDGEIDSITRLPIVSLYGKKRKPTKKDLSNIDVIVFDIQDVGVRFFTYISTLFYVMEAAAENDIELIVLDRPNPNGHYIDGPILEDKYKSFVGLLPIPIVYGMTMGELANMINGERWLGNGLKCDLTVIKNTNYTHLSHYKLPIPPSPNLPNFTAVSLYPSLCFFEGTIVSVGRGTDFPFQQIGHPNLKDFYKYSFVPKPNIGASKPKLNGDICYGINLRDIKIKNFRYKSKIELKWLVGFYGKLKERGDFFLKNNWIDKLAGTDSLRKMIIGGKSAEEIRDSWKTDLEIFNAKRKKYLLYTDFN